MKPLRCRNLVSRFLIKGKTFSGANMHANYRYTRREGGSAAAPASTAPPLQRPLPSAAAAAAGGRVVRASEASLVKNQFGLAVVGPILESIDSQKMMASATLSASSPRHHASATSSTRGTSPVMQSISESHPYPYPHILFKDQGFWDSVSFLEGSRERGATLCVSVAKTNLGCSTSG